ncbi:MAG TPA: tannase/feruloyl esterase family alpha/beta hydrolase [Bryobacteraceae bacterium]|nr:tannase/feruloyl esterase family alpha/beta hydrolase [Bryobacteraceae bacterium]
MKFLYVCAICAVIAQAQPAVKTITEADCTAAKLGTGIPVSSIGLPVSEVTLAPPRWHAETGGYCSIEGSMAPVDQSKTARPIRFGVALPASWMMRAAQLGGGGMNGVIPRLNGPASRGGTPLLQQGFATYGSDSGHQIGGANDWVLNDEAIANLGYMQLKKTHDAAMVLIRRVYDAAPRFNYFFGTSQGGREALTVAQRFPADYDGIAAEVPIVNFSTLMLAPELIRIQEKPIANWVTPAKVNAIRGEVMRQCDALDGLADGIVNNYMACRAIFDVKEGAPGRHPWAAKRCPDNKDPNPADTSAAACLTDGQISTLEMVYSPYTFATPLANGVKTFGMWFPNTDPSGSGLILPARFRGQEGAAENAPMHSHLGVLGVTGFLMRDVNANPLDYVEGGPLNTRRKELSAMLDSTDPDLSAYRRRGGKLIVVIGTNDTLASPGAQVEYYQAVLNKMGRAAVDSFARFFVLPQTDHGLNGGSYGAVSAAIPNTYDRVGIITGWVEKSAVPGKSVNVTAGARSLPMCSYPEYPKYRNGPPEQAGSYTCSNPSD